MSALADEIRAALRDVLREELPRVLSDLRPAPPQPMPTLARLSVREAAELAHRHPDTLRRAIKAGELRATKPAGGREWILNAADIERWIRGDGAPAALDVQAEVDKAVARVSDR